MAKKGYVVDHDTTSGEAHSGDYEYVGGLVGWAENEDDAEHVYSNGGRDLTINSWFNDVPDSSYYNTGPYEVKYAYSFDTGDFVVTAVEPDNGENVGDAYYDIEISGDVGVGLGPFGLTLANVDFQQSGDVSYSDDQGPTHGSGSWTISRTIYDDFPTAQDPCNGVWMWVEDGDDNTTKEIHYFNWSSDYMIAYQDTSQDTMPIVSTETVTINGSPWIYGH